MIKFTKNNFKKWLESFTDRQIVGNTLDTKSCPIARFLTACGSESAEVGTIYYQNAKGVSKKIPVWARKFVFAVDGLYISKNRKKITAKKALTLLENV